MSSATTFHRLGPCLPATPTCAFWIENNSKNEVLLLPPPPHYYYYYYYYYCESNAHLTNNLLTSTTNSQSQKPKFQNTNQFSVHTPYFITYAYHILRNILIPYTSWRTRTVYFAGVFDKAGFFRVRNCISTPPVATILTHHSDTPHLQQQQQQQQHNSVSL
jgi:hypothetical protein